MGSHGSDPESLNSDVRFFATMINSSMLVLAALSLPFKDLLRLTINIFFILKIINVH